MKEGRESGKLISRNTFVQDVINGVLKRVIIERETVLNRAPPAKDDATRDGVVILPVRAKVDGVGTGIAIFRARIAIL